VASIYGGRARRISGPCPPEVFAYDDTAPLPAYDPELARALLREAGDGEHLFLLAGTKRTFDPHSTVTRLYGNGSTFGRQYYGNPEIDPLAAEAAAEPDARRRSALYGDILATLRADGPALWLAQLDDLYALRPGVVWQPRADTLLRLRA
jgi:ABC-type transport system substrate-binding protein